MRLRYAQRALDDLERLADFLAATDPALAAQTGPLILEALKLLERHPMAGRPVGGGLRELVISRGRTGYVALYGIDLPSESIRVLRLRHQREQGFGEAD